MREVGPPRLFGEFTSHNTRQAKHSTWSLQVASTFDVTVWNFQLQLMLAQVKSALLQQQQQLPLYDATTTLGAVRSAQPPHNHFHGVAHGGIF